MRVVCEKCGYEWEPTPRGEEAIRAFYASVNDPLPEDEEILFGHCWRHAHGHPDFMRIRELNQ